MAFAAVGALGRGTPPTGSYISTNANLPCASQTWTKLTINVTWACHDETSGRITLAIGAIHNRALLTTTTNLRRNRRLFVPFWRF